MLNARGKRFRTLWFPTTESASYANENLREEPPLSRKLIFPLYRLFRMTNANRRHHRAWCGKARHREIANIKYLNIIRI